MSIELKFGESKQIRLGTHRQEVYYNNFFVGFLYTRERNILSQLDEWFCIPDVDKGLEDGRWVVLRHFTDYDEVLRYVQDNFAQIVNIVNNGDWD